MAKRGWLWPLKGLFSVLFPIFHFPMIAWLALLKRWSYGRVREGTDRSTRPLFLLVTNGTWCPFSWNFHCLLLFVIARLAYPVIYWTFIFLTPSYHLTRFSLTFFISLFLSYSLYINSAFWSIGSGNQDFGFAVYVLYFAAGFYPMPLSCLLLLIMEDYHNHITASIGTLTSIFPSIPRIMNRYCI